MKRFLLLFPVFALFVLPAALAQDAARPERVNDVIVLELFSSQACVFCPKADRLLSDLVQNENVIGLSCHVDYFDVKEGSLAKPLCSERQSMYEKKLRSGPEYTPQLIINGTYERVGYKLSDISNTIQKARKKPPAHIEIGATDKFEIFEVLLPEMKLAKPVRTQVIFFDEPHSVTIAEGPNKGQQMNYTNMISRIKDLIEWDGTPQKLQIEVVMKPGEKGFVVLATQDNAKIIAAGQFIKK